MTMKESQADSDSQEQTQAVTTVEVTEQTSTTQEASSEVEAIETKDNHSGSEADESIESEEESESQVDDDESDEDSDDDEALVPLAKLKKVRGEAKNLRDRLRTVEARIVELEQSPKNDELQSQYESLVVSIRQERLERLIADEAGNANAIEPSAISKLINADDVVWTDNSPSNVEAIVTQLKSQYPKLFVAVHGTSNAGARDERVIDDNLSPESRLKLAYANKK
jgi:hypothetical protein